MNNSAIASENPPKRPWQISIIVFALLLIFFKVAFSLPDIIRCEGGGLGCLMVLIIFVPALVIFMYLLTYAVWGVSYGERRGLTLATVCCSVGLLIPLLVFLDSDIFDYLDTFDYIVAIMSVLVFTPALFLSLYLRRHPFYDISRPRTTLPRHSLRETLAIAFSKDRSLGEIFEVRDVVFLILLSAPALVGVVTGFVLANDSLTGPFFGAQIIIISFLLEIFTFLLFFIGGKKLIRNTMILAASVLAGFVLLLILTS